MATPKAVGRTALLLGKTGLIGSRCAAHLLDDDAYASVVCLVRRAGTTKHERLDERVVDFDALVSGEADLDVAKIDDVFCAIGSTMKKAGSKEAFRRIDYELPLALAKLAVARGATRMALVSSVGADAHARNFYLKTKGELEDALATLLSKQDGTLHVFRPSFLVGRREESRPGEALGIGIAKATRGLLFGGLRKYRPIDADVVARAMVAAMRAPGGDEARGRIVHELDSIEALSST